MESILQFAARHHLRVKRDRTRDPIIAGKRAAQDLPDRLEYRHHIFDFGGGRLGVCLMFPTKARWTYAKKKLVPAGFVLRQDGDTEGILSFDPKNPKQVRMAIQVTGARLKRQATPAQLAALAKARTAQNALQTAEISAQKASLASRSDENLK